MWRVRPIAGRWRVRLLAVRTRTDEQQGRILVARGVRTSRWWVPIDRTHLAVENDSVLRCAVDGCRVPAVRERLLGRLRRPTHSSVDGRKFRGWVLPAPSGRSGRDAATEPSSGVDELLLSLASSPRPFAKTEKTWRARTGASIGSLRSLSGSCN